MSGPKLEQYPGYYPAGSRPFWSRAKVAIAAGVIGLIVGIAGGGSDAEPAAASDTGQSVADVRADLDHALAAKSDLSDQLRDQTDEAAADSSRAAKTAATSQQKAVRRAVAKVRQEERKKMVAAVKSARAQATAAAVAAAPSTPAIAPLASTTQSSTDPRFSYCYEANDAGFGPYYQGQDPEYGWYDDRDGDGIVCEY